MDGTHRVQWVPLVVDGVGVADHPLGVVHVDRQQFGATRMIERKYV